MQRFLASIALGLLALSQACGHFVFLVPDAEGTTLEVVFSDSLAPDEAVSIDKISSTKLVLRDASGKETPLPFEKGKHSLTATLSGKNGRLVQGTTEYGVLAKGTGKPFLLKYHSRALLGAMDSTKPGTGAPVEIVPVLAEGKVRFRFQVAGKPVEKSELTVIVPGKEKSEKVTTNSKGETRAFDAAGRYGVWGRHTEDKAGEADGKKYEEVRHYATLVMDVKGKKVYSDLPRAVSSFGAVVSEGKVYVYGGHSGKAHTYSTEDVLGNFRRMIPGEGKGWEELPAGPGLQGLALVEHKGKIYRIGGMQPRNKAGEKADNISVATCACYDPATRKWQEMPALPEPRSSHDAVVLHNKIYVVGGWKLNGAGKEPNWHTTVAVLDLDASPLQWKSFQQPFSRRAMTAASYDGKVYVIAGMTGSHETVLGVDIYDPEKEKWTTGASIPGPTFNGFTPASCVAGEKLYVSTADGKLHRLSPKGDRWETVGSLEQPRYVHRMVAVTPSTMLAIGGASKKGNVALTEVLEAR